MKGEITPFKSVEEIAQELVGKLTVNELTELIIHIEKLTK